MATFKNTIYLTTYDATPVDILQVTTPTSANTLIRITVAGSDTTSPLANRFYADRKWLQSDWGLDTALLDDFSYYDDVTVGIECDSTGKMSVTGNSLTCSWTIFYEVFSSSASATVTEL